MKMAVAAVAIVSVIGLAIYFGPSQYQEHQAKQQVRLLFRDPDSVKFTQVHTQNGNVCGFANAKNGYGAYQGQVLFIAPKNKPAELGPDDGTGDGSDIASLGDACVKEIELNAELASLGSQDTSTFRCDAYNERKKHYEAVIAWLKKVRTSCQFAK